MNKILLTILITALLVLSFSAGFFLQAKKSASDSFTITSAKTLLKGLASKMVFASARGKITKISGRTLTISNQGNNIDVLILRNAMISAYDEKTGNSIPLEFSFLKTGNEITVFLTPDIKGVLNGLKVEINY